MHEDKRESRHRDDSAVSGSGEVTEGLGRQFELDQLRHAKREEEELAEHPEASGEVTEGLGHQFELDQLKHAREERGAVEDDRD